MRNLISFIKTNISDPSIWKFFIVGVLNTIVDFSVFFTLYFWFGKTIITANIIAFLIATTNSYFLNKFWSFSHKNSGHANYKQFLLFVAASTLSVGITTGILILGEPFIPILYLKIIASFFAPAFNYLLYRQVIFRHQP